MFGQQFQQQTMHLLDPAAQPGKHDSPLYNLLMLLAVPHEKPGPVQACGACIACIDFSAVALKTSLVGQPCRLYLPSRETRTT